MKNVLIYNIVNKLRYTNDTLINTLKAQIDNSLLNGWPPEDIILGTNFDFEYKGIKNIPLKDICEFNPFINKWYGIAELIEMGVLKEDFWLHDQDNWQVSKFQFPEFQNEIGGCLYREGGEFNTGSLFFKIKSAMIIKYIVDFMKINSTLNWSSDEDYIATLKNNTPVAKYFSILNTEYNVGMTNFDYRFNIANKPIKVIGVKPHEKKDLDFYIGKNLVPTELFNIFKNNNLTT
jgi:hypothetical protein